ncbi:Serine/threonine-protein kinase RIO1 [Chytriomyces hyalinus]|nr:Serine/threonine-protein kinase RIO1 [Chytriomyces hyalinus]
MKKSHGAGAKRLDTDTDTSGPADGDSGRFSDADDEGGLSSSEVLGNKAASAGGASTAQAHPRVLNEGAPPTLLGRTDSDTAITSMPSKTSHSHSHGHSLHAAPHYYQHSNHMGHASGSHVKTSVGASAAVSDVPLPTPHSDVVDRDQTLPRNLRMHTTFAVSPSKEGKEVRESRERDNSRSSVPHTPISKTVVSSSSASSGLDNSPTNQQGETSGGDADEEEGAGRDMDDDFWNDDDALLDDEDGEDDDDEDAEDYNAFGDDLDEDDVDEDTQNLVDELDYGDQWHNATGDFTKQFNKMRNQIAASSGAATGTMIAPSNSGAAQRAAARELALSRAAAAAGTAGTATTVKKAKPASAPSDQALMDELSAKFASKIRIDPLVFESKNLSASVRGDMKVSSRKAEGDKTVYKDKADRATVEQVLDPRTRMILFKLLNNQTLSAVNGCISTGKEANVYHATTPDGGHRAIKVYKTSILVFKDRDRYVSGEFRFRHGYAKSNPRKMVKVWAEKEMRNLKRLNVAGILCPEPVLLRMHVLLMTFLGDKNGWASPRLKDAVINDSMIYKNLYIHLIKMVWKMYHKCKLVHADLSEYNLLYHNKTLYIIDVSQSVEHDHPHALEFLRKDCTNIVDYFKKRVPPLDESYPDSVDVFSLRELFDYIVTDYDTVLRTCIDKNLLPAEYAQNPKEAGEDAILDAYTAYMHTAAARRSVADVAAKSGISVAAAQAEADVAEAVFKQSYIPRTLQEIVDYERDVDKAKAGVVEGNVGVGVYARVTGLVLDGVVAADNDGRQQAGSGVSGSGGGLGKLAAIAAAATANVEGVTASKSVASKSVVPVDPSGRSSSAGKTARIEVNEPDLQDEENSDGGDDGDDDSDEDASGSDDEDGDGSDYDEDSGKISRLKKDEDKDAKKARKQAQKEDKREKRKAKMPKAVKKRKQKVSSDKKK